MADEEVKTSESEKKKEDWMNSKWRPMMGWMYMLVCTMDFVGFPVLWSLLQMVSHGNVSSQWQPLTLQGAGLFHIAMGAVIGISAYGRTQEKLGGANNGGVQFPQGAGTTYVPPGQGNVNVSNQTPTGGFGGFGNGGAGTATTGFQGGSPAFGSSAAGGFGSSGGFGSPAPVTSGFGAQPLGSGSSFGSAPSTAVAPAPSWGTTPAVSKPAPSRPPLDEKFPPLD